MSSRSVPEWIGKSPDEDVPKRVRIRVWDRASGHCEVCTRKLAPGDKWQADHTRAVINGGANRESNLRLICDWCHKAKTAEDVAEKAVTARVRSKHIGIKKKSGRAMPGSRDSKWKQTINNGWVLR
jgi:5-methylcytosine-specific restriction protein A